MVTSSRAFYPKSGTTSGTFAAGNHHHAGSDVDSGTVAYARLPVGTTANTVAAGDTTVNLTGAQTVAGVKTFSSEPVAPSIQVTGITGAVNPGRFVGVTTSGAPSTGTFAVGDFVVSQNGQMFVCVVAGSPGTWVYPRDATNLLASGEETMARDMATQSMGANTGNLYLSYGTFRKSESTTQVRITTFTTAAAATPSLVRIGLYTIASDGAGTLVASIASDTTLFAAASTTYTKSWTTPYSKVAGQRYALGVLVVTATTAPTLCGAPLPRGTEPAAAPKLCAFLGSQTDLPSSFTDASLSNTSSRFYGVVA